MSLGQYISGAAHAGLIGWLIVGWGLSSDPLPFDVTEVSLISGEEFDALTRLGAPDAVLDDSPTPVAPPPAEAPQPPEPEPEAPAPSVPEAPAPQPEPAPAPPAPAQLSDAPADAPADAPPAPLASDGPVLVVEDAPRPRPRPSQRIAADPVAPPPDDAAPGEVAREAVQPDPAPAPEPVPQPEQEASAPQEAATEIVPQDQEPAGAPEISLRPRGRPDRPAPPSEPTPAPASEGSTSTASSVDAVAAALDAALAASNDAPAPQTGQASGESLSRVTLSNFLGQIRECWNLGFASADVQRTIVTVGFAMTPEGQIEPGSVRLVGQTGGTDATAEIAFRAARDALQDCQDFGGRTGYSLPQDKYDLWRNIEMRFNPETMRLR